MEAIGVGFGDMRPVAGAKDSWGLGVWLYTVKTGLNCSHLVRLALRAWVEVWGLSVSE